MLRAECPECGEFVALDDDVRVGDQVVCIECGVELEVLSLYPLVLDYVLADEWEDEWEDDWEDELE